MGDEVDGLRTESDMRAEELFAVAVVSDVAGGEEFCTAFWRVDPMIDQWTASSSGGAWRVMRCRA
jgi:hypothetical protein